MHEKIVCGIFFYVKHFLRKKDFRKNVFTHQQTLIVALIRIDKSAFQC